jgi:transcriptional repressor NrdR
MLCPKCKHAETQVVDTRDSSDGIRRRRECLTCKHRFTTYERGEPVNIVVVKKDGNRERFNAEKIRKGVSIACKNRPVSPEDIDQLVEHIEHLVSFRGQDTVTSQEIGRFVEEKLRELDEVAYVRFVSVYQSFTDIEQFSDAIKSLS